jgi:hypothetical protein
MSEQIAQLVGGIFMRHQSLTGGESDGFDHDLIYSFCQFPQQHAFNTCMKNDICLEMGIRGERHTNNMIAVAHLNVRNLAFVMGGMSTT